jgi:hypothetical protein
MPCGDLEFVGREFLIPPKGHGLCAIWAAPLLYRDEFFVAIDVWGLGAGRFRPSCRRFRRHDRGIDHLLESSGESLVVMMLPFSRDACPLIVP